MIRVFLVDDHAVFRAGLKRLLEDEEDLEVAGEAAGGVELLRLLPTLSCDVLLLDLSLPGRNGFDLLEAVRATRPEIRVVVLSMFPEAQYAARLLRAGALGYLSKGRTSVELLAAIRAAGKGERYLTDIASERWEEAHRLEGALPHERLTDREAEIFRRLSLGTSPTDIAAELGLAQSTVGTFVSRIKDKLGVSSLGEIVQYAYRHRLVE